MAAPMADVSEMDDAEKSSGKCILEATVTTGFEPIAKAEAVEKLNAKVSELRGRIKIYCPIENVHKIMDLGSVDNLLVVMCHVENFGFTEDKIDNLQRLRNLVGGVDWPSGLRIWHKFFSFEHPIRDVPEVYPANFGEVTEPPPRQTKLPASKSKKRNKWKRLREEKRANEENQDNVTPNVESAKDTDKVQDAEKECHTEKCDGDKTEEDQPKVKKPPSNPWDPLKPSFRVTCNRNGDNHNFDSMTAASNFGGAVYQYFGWNVKMKEFDIEVILNIDDQDVRVCLGLTRGSLHRRNISSFGRTTLRPTVAYNMLRLCEIKTGDVVCDPMCGSGSIPIQSAVSWPNSYNICGEIAKNGVIKTFENITNLGETREKEGLRRPCVDPIKWDACRLPVRDQAIDVFITDLPFGLRVGSKADNWKLYPGALLEMARVTRHETGRACLLTQDKKCMIKTLMSVGRYWKRTRTLGINLGGLAAGVYVLQRTAEPYTQGTKVQITPDDHTQDSDKST